MDPRATNGELSGAARGRCWTVIEEDSPVGSSSSSSTTETRDEELPLSSCCVLGNFLQYMSMAILLTTNEHTAVLSH